MTDHWDVRCGGLPPESLSIPSDVASDMGLFVPTVWQEEQGALHDLTQERRTEHDATANYQVVDGLLRQLPQATHVSYQRPGGRIEAKTLEQAKLVQHFAMFDASGMPYYLIGRRPDPELRQTQLLLGPAFQFDEPNPTPLVMRTVYDEDLMAYDESIVAQHKELYSENEIRGLRLTGSDGYFIGRDHPRSAFLAPDTTLPFGRWLHKPNLDRGIRGPNYECQNDIRAIGDKDLESFEVYDHLNNLAAAFDKRAVLEQLIRRRFGQPEPRNDRHAPRAEATRMIGARLLQKVRRFIGPTTAA